MFTSQVEPHLHNIPTGFPINDGSACIKPGEL